METLRSAAVARLLFAVAACTLSLSGCGAGGSDSSGGGSSPSLNTGSATISVALQDLSAGRVVVLREAASGQNLTLNVSGNFPFTAPVSLGLPYMVTVQSQPAGQTCEVENGSGMITRNALTVTVRCHNSGSLDLSFGSNGKVITDISPSFDEIYDLAMQPDGKIVSVGRTTTGTGYAFAIARYNSNGTLDAGFGTGGIVTTAIGTVNNGADGDYVAIQSDGKIVVVGQSSIPGSGFGVVRYNSNGTLDQTFGGGDGIVTTPIGVFPNEANAVAIQSDGRIIVAGNSSSLTNDFTVVRYLPDGTIDATFGNGGRATALGLGFVSTVVVQPDGRVIVGGTGTAGRIARFLPTGSLDGTFGTAGTVTTTGMSINKIAIQTDGKIVAAGSSFTSSAYEIARFNTNGSPDQTFGSAGRRTIPIGVPSFATGPRAYDVVIQADGRIVAGGGAFNGFNDDIALARVDLNGTIDNLFGQNGMVLTEITPGLGYDYGHGMALQADGRLVMGGTTALVGGNNAFALTRYWQ